MKPELRFEKKKMRVAELGAESCLPDLLGELVLQNQLEFKLGEEDEIYEGYGRRANAYPYRQYNRYTRSLSEKEIFTAVLENRYLKAVFLPEYGGRLWELWDKETGRNLLYTNDVLRFSNLAVRNAWFSGGVEWNIGVIGHNPLTTDCLYTARTATDKGEPVLRMYEYERVRGCVYQMDFWLEKEGVFLNCRMRITNESEKVIPMYWWSNIAVPEYEKGRIIVPAETAYTYEDGAVFKVDIPFVHGIDVTDYKKIEKSVDYFFDIPQNSPKYIANVDNTGYGLLQVSTKRQRSRKLFSWGNQEASDHWQEFLTHSAGRYTEIQAGLGKTQYGCIPMPPHTAWEWMEQYGRVQLSGDTLAKDHRERAACMTKQLKDQNTEERLEQVLKETKEMAKKKAELIITGSGYGALAERGKSTAHLTFCLKEDALQKWKHFFDTGILHCSNSSDTPDAFLLNEENTKFLEKNMAGKNETNWYAHYHLGIGYYIRGEYEKAEKALEQSCMLAENPWVYHALSCTNLLLEKKEKAAGYILKGMESKRAEVSYLKEGFKLLFLCEEYVKLCRFYESLAKNQQNIGKLRFYYISALHRLGEEEKAYGMLEQDGGLQMEDIREGEDSIARLWEELHLSLYGEKGKIPYKYNFKAY